MRVAQRGSDAAINRLMLYSSESMLIGLGLGFLDSSKICYIDLIFTFVRLR